MLAHQAITSYFKRQGVPRDLGAKIRAKADAIVSTINVDSNVSL